MKNYVKINLEEYESLKNEVIALRQSLESEKVVFIRCKSPLGGEFYKIYSPSEAIQKLIKEVKDAEVMAYSNVKSLNEIRGELSSIKRKNLISLIIWYFNKL